MIENTFKVIIKLLVIFVFVSQGHIYGQKLDSLKTALTVEKDPISRLILLGKLSENCDVKDIEFYCTQSQELLKSLSPEVVSKNRNILLIEESRINNNLSYYFFKLSLYAKSEDYSMKSILSLEKTHLDTSLLISAYNNLASVYLSMKNYEKAISIFRKNLVFDYSKKDSLSLSLDYNNISSAFRQLDVTDSAIYYSKKSIELKEYFNANADLIKSYRLLGVIYLDVNALDSAQLYMNKALNIAIELNEKPDFQLIYYWKGMIEKKLGDMKKAENYFLQSLLYAKGSSGLTSLYTTHLELYKLYENQKNYGNALYHYKQYKLYEDSVISEKLQKESEIKQVKFDYSKKEIELTDKQEKEMAISNEEKKRQRLIILFGIVTIILIVLFLVFVLNRARILTKQKQFIQKQRDLLFTQQEELVDKNTLLDKKNTTITENINYAKNIQNSLIPTEEKISSTLHKECFVMFHPKDIVSGDFYWSCTKNNKQLFILADCTGHGVTGAFISILAIKSLEKVVGNHDLNDLNSVVKQLHNDFLFTFGDDTNNHYGIEFVVCCFDTQSNKMIITGSSNSVCVVSKGELEHFKFDNLSIGTKNADVSSIEIREVNLVPGSTVYLYTDGYFDQKGGPQNKRFFSKSLRNKFVEIASLDMKAQKQELINTFFDWKQTNEQIDDVSVIGIKIT